MAIVTKQGRKQNERGDRRVNQGRRRVSCAESAAKMGHTIKGVRLNAQHVSFRSGTSVSNIFWLWLSLSLFMAFFLSMDTANAALTNSRERGNRKPLDNLITQWETAAEVEFAYMHLSQLEVLRRIKLGRLNVNPTAAVAYASHFVVRTFHWEKQASLDMMLQAQLLPLNLTKQQKIRARRFAISVALPIVRQRIGDDILEYQDRQPAPVNGPPGVYQYTPEQLFFFNGASGGAPPIIADKPEAYRSAIPGPPPVPSPEYNTDLREVREYGALFGSRRSQEQEQVLNFVGSLDIATYLRMWAIVAKQVLPHNISLYDTAYVFAAMAIVQQDGLASVFDNKWYHFFWRPVTAIRQGDPQNRPDPDWTPATITSFDPEYPSGAAFAAASGKFPLQDYLGTENVTFSLSANIPGEGNVTRTYHSLSALTEEIGNYRIYAGNHYRFSVRDGAKLADKIGRDVVRRLKVM